MVINFSHLLWSAARSFLLSSGGNVDVAQRFLQRWSSADKLEITRCSKEIGADFAASVSFKIGQLYTKEVNGAVLSPEQIASSLLEEVRKFDNCDWFEAGVGGGGYINFSLKESGKDQFVEIASRDPQQLFSATEMGVGSSQIIKPIEISIPSFWDAPLIRARDSESEELKEFAGKLESASSFSFEDFLMTLVCLDDSNHDLIPYLENLKGSQNIPWFLDRFFSDVRLLSEMFRGNSDRLVSISEIHSRHLYNSAVVGRDLLVQFRFVLFQSLRSTRPEILLSYLLKIVKEFYRSYNYPELRRELMEFRSGGGVSSQLLFFSRQAFLFEEIVSLSLKNLANFYSKIGDLKQ